MDPRIISVHLATSPTGALLGETVRPENRKEIGTTPERADGMLPQWGVSVFHILQRLDSFRSKTRYVAVGRDRFSGMFFPFASNENVLIAMTLDKKAVPAEIYEIVNRYVEENKLLI